MTNKNILTQKEEERRQNSNEFGKSIKNNIEKENNLNYIKNKNDQGFHCL